MAFLNRQSQDRSRTGLWCREVDEARRLRETLRERKSEGPGPRVVVDEESEWETGVDTTRVMAGDVTRGSVGGRMVETEPPRERTDWVLWDGRGADRTDAGEDGGCMASGEGCRAEPELESDDCGESALGGGEAISERVIYTAVSAGWRRQARCESLEGQSREEPRNASVGGSHATMPPSWPDMAGSVLVAQAVLL